MKNMLKAIAMILVVCLIAAAFTACRNKKNDDPGTPSVTQAPSEEGNSGNGSAENGNNTQNGNGGSDTEPGTTAEPGASGDPAEATSEPDAEPTVEPTGLEEGGDLNIDVPEGQSSGGL